VSLWFKGKELAFALGINISFSRLASTVNNIVVPRTYDIRDNIGDGFMLGYFLCIMSLGTAIMLAYLDVYADKKDLENEA
jgi:hypothetical protein